MKRPKYFHLRLQNKAILTCSLLMAMQTTKNILMVRPHHFQVNIQTTTSNYFQQPDMLKADSASIALRQFDQYVRALRDAGVNVTVIQDDRHGQTPDSVFPNNWLTCHADGRVFLYPMEAKNRRLERCPEVLKALASQFQIHQVIDLSQHEMEGRFLEGTGSLVFDHQHRLAYVCRSSRSDMTVLDELMTYLGYQVIDFHAVDAMGRAIYHTNVMMSIGTKLAIVCTASLTDPTEKTRLLQSLEKTGKEVIDINFSQMHAFAGNVIELKNDDGDAILAMSVRAWRSFSPVQQKQIQTHVIPVMSDLSVIEDLGGGGARCMVAEIFLPEQQKEME